MSLNSTEWGFLAKICYKLFGRKLLEKAVKSTENTLDDTILIELDKMVK